LFLGRNDMAKVIIQIPYILKPGPRQAKADKLRKQWEENDVIVLDASVNCKIVKEDDELIIKSNDWIPLTHEAVDNDLKDHWFYLVADKRFGTPMKALFHLDPLAHFEIVSTSKFNNNDIVYVYDLAGDWSPQRDACPITHYMELPSLPWEDKSNDT